MSDRSSDCGATLVFELQDDADPNDAVALLRREWVDATGKPAWS